LASVVESSNGTGVAWMVGALPPATTGDPATIDPATKAIFPLAMTNTNGVVSFTADDGLRVEVMSFALPFKSFRMAVGLGADGNSLAPAVLTGSTVCANVPMYGPFLDELGLCNPQTDVLSFFGGANFTKRSDVMAPANVGQVAFAIANGAVTATLTGSQLALKDHLASILLVDATTGKPVTLGYGLDTTRTAAMDGTIATVSVPFGMNTVPKSVRAYLMIDTSAAAMSALSM
jgi:hypothetical protein